MCIEYNVVLPGLRHLVVVYIEITSQVLVSGHLRPHNL